MEINKDANTRCVKLKGRLDAGSSNELDLALTAMAVDGEDIIIDMSECNYMSSAGIRILLKARKKMLSGQSELYLTGLVPDVVRVLEIAGLFSLLRIESDVDTALALVEAARQKRLGVREIAVGHHRLVYNPAVEDSISGRCLNAKQDISFSELGYALGFGSLSGTGTGSSECPDFFASLSKGVGFLPPAGSADPDFRMISDPDKAVIPVCEALSFGQHPTGTMKLTSPGILTFSQVNEAINSLKGTSFAEGSVVLRIVANFDKSAPSVSFFVANDENLAAVVNTAGMKQFGKLLQENLGKNAFVGITVQLSGLDIPSKDVLPEEIMRDNLTFENLLAVKPFNTGTFLENPVIWLFHAARF